MLKLLRFEKRFQKAPFSGRNSVDRNIAAVLNFTVVPKTALNLTSIHIYSQNDSKRFTSVFFRISSEVSVEDVRQTIQSVDPEAPTEVVDKYLERAFNIATDQLEPGTKIETTLLIKRLQSGSVRRLGAKPK